MALCRRSLIRIHYKPLVGWGTQNTPANNGVAILVPSKDIATAAEPHKRKGVVLGEQFGQNIQAGQRDPEHFRFFSSDMCIYIIMFMLWVIMLCCQPKRACAPQRGLDLAAIAFKLLNIH